MILQDDLLEAVLLIKLSRDSGVIFIDDDMLDAGDRLRSTMSVREN
jgi:hypothetical protein